MSSDALTIVVGINLIESNNDGRVEIYTRNINDNEWNLNETINEQNPETAFGKTVALSPNGNYLAVSAPEEDGGGGKVFIYYRVGNTYNFIQMLEQNTGFRQDGRFGLALAINENIAGIVTVAVGSNQYAFFTGRTWLHTNATGSFVQQVVIPTGGLGETSNIQWGGSVCITGDGNTVYTSALGSGCRVTYKFEQSFPNVWTQTGAILPGAGFENPPDDGSYSFGISNSVSSDNTVVAIGALDQAVYVYNSSGREYGPGRIPLIPGNSFAIKTVVSGNGTTMAVLASNRCCVYITSPI